jgi:hypothetical protein
MTPADYVMRACSCGRVIRDYTDLAVIIEEDGYCFRGNGTKRKEGKSKVVCLRPGCYGMYKTHKVYSKKLKRILNITYIRLKQQQDEEET